MNPFSSTTSSDIGLSSSDIVNSGLSLITSLSPILLIGLAIYAAYLFMRLIRSAFNLYSINKENGKTYSISEFILKSKYEKENKFHPDRYFSGHSRRQKYDEYLRVTENGRRNDKW